MAKCGYCGRELPDGAKYCDRCGMIHLLRPWEISGEEGIRTEEKSIEELIAEKPPDGRPPESRPAQTAAPLPMFLLQPRRRRLVKALAVLAVLCIVLASVVYQTGRLTGEKIAEKEIGLSGAAGVGAKFKYNSAGPTFNFVLRGYGLDKKTRYTSSFAKCRCRQRRCQTDARGSRMR